jgi:hypothetical protein
LEQKSKRIQISIKFLKFYLFLSFTKALQNDEEDEQQPTNENKNSITQNKKIFNERVPKLE